MTLKNNHNGSNYDHDDGDDEEKNEHDDHCCHFLDSCCIKLVLLFSGTLPRFEEREIRGMRGS